MLQRVKEMALFPLQGPIDFPEGNGLVDVAPLP